MNIAVILAGGTGSRFGNEIPKQFLEIAGKTVIEHSVNVFETHPKIDEIAIVIHRDFVETIENFVIKNCWKKVKKILIGGEERHFSSLAAIDAFTDFPNCNLLFHDAVRPLVSHEIINNVIEALKNYSAVSVAIPSIDTLYFINPQNKIIESIPNRAHLMRAQTPQAFKQQTIKEAYQIAFQDSDFSSTDDCGIVKKYLPNEPIFVVDGEESNSKLTYKEDLIFIEKIISQIRK